jgi:hypothetical protein
MLSYRDEEDIVLWISCQIRHIDSLQTGISVIYQGLQGEASTVHISIYIHTYRSDRRGFHRMWRSDRQQQATANSYRFRGDFVKMQRF